LLWRRKVGLQPNPSRRDRALRLLAQRGTAYHVDIRLQSDNETAFFDV
jgi:protocatechuate 3,4-dioxygenase beta subunit